MKVLITHNYYLRLDAKQWAAQKPYAPLATLYAAAAVRHAGHQVHFHDVQFEAGPAHFEAVVNRIKPDVVVLYEDGFNYLTKMCLTNMRHAAYAMIGFAKVAGAEVFISGSDSTDHYQEYLEKGADVVIFGEADETLLLLVESQQSTVNGQRSTVDRGAWTKIPGIAYIEGGSTKTTPRGPVLKDLDSLPFPAWDLLDIKPYQNAWKQHGYFSVNMATTRGCPFKCNWCAKPIYGNRYNSHSAKYVVDLMRHMRQFFSFDHIWFADDIFGLKPGWVQQFSEEMEKAGLRIPFKIQSRADLLVHGNTAAALAAAGCDEVWMGAESGSQKVLDAMDKGTTIAQIEASTKLLKHHGIKPCFFLQFGYPGENWDDILATIDLVERLQPFDIGVSVSYPLPGTPFFENVKSQLSGKANWTDSDELLLMYRGTFSADFYKTLHRFVHRKFRAAAAKRRFLKSGSPKSAAAFAYHKPLAVFEKLRVQKLLEKERDL
jgi:radical SAM superfamily enzyme YgiQ (UPF0313 family)